MHVTKRRDLAMFLAVLGLANFFLFLILSALLGGSAANGRIQAGHYFVGEHGKYTEVSSLIFRINQIHGYTLILTHPLAIISLAYAVSIKRQAENYPFHEDSRE
jgi:hypothetical protein